MGLVMTLTNEQQAVVDSDAPKILVNATPGSGKSRVLVERIKRLVRDGADPARIVCITFTCSAAAVLQDRLGDIRLGFASTLHGWCFGLLARHGHLLGLDGSLSVVDEDGQAELLAEAIRDMAWKGSVKDIQLEVAKGPCDRTKPLTKAGLAAEAFFQRLAADRILTFDMIEHWGLKLFQKDPSVVNADFIFLDEAQDCTDLEWQILDAAQVPNFMAIGDADQRLYSWRGSSDQFEKRCRMALHQE